MSHVPKSVQTEIDGLSVDDYLSKEGHFLNADVLL